MNFDYGATPINALTARVTSQGGCASDDTLSDEQKRENLVLQIKLVQKRLTQVRKGSEERKSLGSVQASLCAQVNALRPKMRAPRLTNHILDVMREELSPIQFKRIIAKASELAKGEL